VSAPLALVLAPVLAIGPLVAALATPLPIAAGLSQGASLSAAAAASGRPPECTSRSKRALAKGPSVWELARVPTLQRYCDLMARAHAELPTMPEAARRAADDADKALPGHAAPQVVIARAALVAGDVAEAAKAFDRARAIDPRSVEEPSTMHDLARTLARTGKRDEALGVYRALVPRADLLATTEQRVRVLLEAAHASMTVEGSGGPAPTLAELARPGARPAGAPPRAKGRPGLDEAIAYLREAHQRSATPLSGDVVLSLALGLDRAGSRDEADAVLAEADRGARAAAGAADYVAAPEDASALAALALEVTDRPAAQKAWEAYLAGVGGKGPWAASARGRLDALKRGGGPRGPKAPEGKPRKPR
jgi:tetratricopeptide (TPR) repeat protein